MRETERNTSYIECQHEFIRDCNENKQLNTACSSTYVFDLSFFHAKHTKIDININLNEEKVKGNHS